VTGKRGFSSHCVLEQVKRGLANLLKHGAGFSRSSSLGFIESYETPEAVKVGL
jgi:hypothetical protein